MMFSFILCLLPALLTTSAQEILTCEKCYGIAQSCQAPTENCTVANGTGGCRSVAGESTLGGIITSAFYKECIGIYDTGIKEPITFTVGNGLYMRLNATQCNNTNKCNSAVLSVPQVNTSLNGLQCPTCFTLNSDSCDGKITPCTGNEIHCIDFSGQMLKGVSLLSFAAQGCGTASTQDIKSQAYLISGPNVYLFSRASSMVAPRIPTTATPSNTTVLTQTPPLSNATGLSQTPPLSNATGLTQTPPLSNATGLTQTPPLSNATGFPKTTASSPLPKTSTSSRSSPVLGQFSLAVYLPGLTGLLLLKLLS